MLSYLIEKKNFLRYNIVKYYYQYGLFCSTRPIILILFSCSVVILCSLPLASFPIFEKILAFLFRRIQVKYNTVILPVNTDKTHGNVFAYIQQININTSISEPMDLSTEDIIENILQLPSIMQLEMLLRQPNGKWNESCLKLHRDPPSMKALKKRIKYGKGSIHNDLRLRRFYLLDCLFVSPNLLFDHGQSEMSLSDFSFPFQELTMGYPMQQFHERTSLLDTNRTKNLAFMFTLFLKKYDRSFQEELLNVLHGEHIEISTPSNIGHAINYQFSLDSAPAELVPLVIAYIVVFLYLWFSVAKLELLRTRWGLAFSAVMNFVLSFLMAIGICATFDALPTAFNVGEIFPYVVILIGIENFWIITKAVMTTKKDLQVQERVARGLASEGWYITKNLVVEILLLLTGYLSGVKGVQQFSTFALACYLSDFFLQMTFFTPILAVDTRRAEIGLPFTNRSAWKYAFYIDIKRPNGVQNLLEYPVSRFTAAVNVAFNMARYRVLQRTVMVLIVIYFGITISLPIQEMVSPTQNAETLSPTNRSFEQMFCWKKDAVNRKTDIISWLFLCGKHWPELLNYYFVHLNEKSLFILPQIDVKIHLTGKHFKPIMPKDKTMLQKIYALIQETSRPFVAVTVIVLLTLVYKLSSIIHTVVQHLNGKTDMYTHWKTELRVPCKKRQFLYKLTKIIVDETDSLVGCYNNGAVYVWDLYEGCCVYHINRKHKEVHNMNITRSLSTYSLPVVEIEPDKTSSELPRAVWSLAKQSDVLIIGCAKGSLEIYTLENESLQCFHQSENSSGIVAVKIISCLRFVIAHENGVIEFCHLKTRKPGHKRTNSLPNASQFLQDLEVSRSVTVSHSPVRIMDIAIDKIFVASEHGQLKILRASDDGGFLLQSQLPHDQDIAVIRAESSPEMVVVGTTTGNVYVLNSLGQTEKQLNCGDAKIMSISSDDDYIAVLSYDCQLTVWLKEGYIKWWQLDLVSYKGAYEIVSLASYTLVALNKDTAIVLNIVSRTVMSTIVYNSNPSVGLLVALPVVCQNNSAVAVPTETNVVHLKFPKLINRDR